MNKFVMSVVSLIGLVLASCGLQSTFSTVKPQGCTVVKVGGVATISCADGTTVDVNDGATGNTGSQGIPGVVGQNGHSVVVSSLPGAALLTDCPTGGSILLAGTDYNDNGNLDGMEVTASMNVCNGAVGATGNTGANGADAPLPLFMPVAAIQPCGVSSYNEVLLGLFGGAIYGEFSGSGSDALGVRNILIPDGGFQTTDSVHCSFTVSTDGSGNRSVAWSGGHHDYTALTSLWTLF